MTFTLPTHGRNICSPNCTREDCLLTCIPLSPLWCDSGTRLQEAMDYKGGDIASEYGIESVAECRAACEAHPRCLAFTFVQADHACWLKGPGYQRSTNPNTVSGAINATLLEQRRSTMNQTVAPDGEPSGRWGDERLGDEGENSYEDMHRREREEGELGDDTWGGRDAGGRGWEDVEAMPDPVIVTDEETERHADATSFFGDVELVAEVPSATECALRCHSRGQCVAWTLLKSRRLCMHRLAGAPLLRYSSDVIGACGRLAETRQACL